MENEELDGISECETCKNNIFNQNPEGVEDLQVMNQLLSDDQKEKRVKWENRQFVANYDFETEKIKKETLIIEKTVSESINRPENPTAWWRIKDGLHNFIEGDWWLSEDGLSFLLTLGGMAGITVIILMDYLPVWAAAIAYPLLSGFNQLGSNMYQKMGKYWDMYSISPFASMPTLKKDTSSVSTTSTLTEIESTEDEDSEDSC